MTQKPVIEAMHWAEANRQLRATSDYSVLMAVNKAIEIALAEQATQDQYISADEARALGAGNAEWLGVDNIWRLQNGIMNPMYRVNLKYRAIRKEVPAEPTFSGLKKVSTEKLVPAWQKLLHDNLWELYESDKLADPLASLPDELLTPEAKTSLGDWIDSKQLESTELHAELKALYAQQVKDGTWINHAWAYCDEDGAWIDEHINPDGSGIGFSWTQEYQYRCKLKTNLVKLDGELMPRKAAIAKWKSKSDTHVMCFKFKLMNWIDVDGFPVDYPSYFFDSCDCEYQLRPKAKKQVSLDPAIREGVIALLQELNFIK